MRSTLRRSPVQTVHVWGGWKLEGEMPVLSLYHISIHINTRDKISLSAPCPICIPTPPSIDFCLSFITYHDDLFIHPYIVVWTYINFFINTHNITNPPEADLRYVVTSPPVMFRPTPSFLAVMCGAMIGRCPWPLIIVDVSRIYMLFRASVSSNNKHQLLANFLHHDTSCLSIRFNFRWRVR